MANMSYCMMENTSRDLYDCLEALSEYNSIEEWKEATDPSEYEVMGVLDLLATARDLVDAFGEQ